MLVIITRLKCIIRELWISNVGGVVIYFAFALPILLGTMALSIDLGRSFILNTELKDFSDAAALAGAAELDGGDGAMVTAEAAARTGISGTLLNVQAFATDGGGPGIVVDQVVFLRRLPADGTDFTAADTATSDANARFIFVSVVNRNVRSGLSRALGVDIKFDTGARSIAGYIAVTCAVPVLFMCNPLEDTAFPPPPGVNCIKKTGAPILGQEDCLMGRQMLIKSGQGGGGQYFPGEFGLLQCPQAMIDAGFGQGAKCSAWSVAMVMPNFCVGDRVKVKTGANTGPITSAINVRFDHYGPQFGGNKSGKPDAPRNNPLFAPALNVTKGWKVSTTEGKGCSDPDVVPASTAPLPRDRCFYDGDCAGSGRYGDGDWQGDLTDPESKGRKYWEINHGESGMPNPPVGYDSMTRYDVYRLEIKSEMDGNAPGIPEPGPAPGGPTLEEGKSCNYTAGDSDDPLGGGFYDPTIASSGIESTDRRLLYLAAINCIEHGPLTGASSNNPDGLPVEAVIEVFLTEPASVPGEPAGEESVGNDKHNIWGEIVGIVDSEDDIQRDIVQLYR